MLTQYIENPGVPGTILHNSAKWQLTNYMGGLCCELMNKEKRVIDHFTQYDMKLGLHECYPSIFLQGDDATEFLQEFEAAESKLSIKQLHRLFFENYAHILH